VKNSEGRAMYPTRLEIPEDVWKQTVDAIESKEKMKEEGRKVAEMGGLHIIGTERHESRRIDNQLRGRAGRQGDPGSSQFFLSLQDELMRLFGGERMAKLMNSPLIGLKDGEAISNGMLSSQIEKAQRKVEEYHFDQRKNLLDYDEVMDTQRKRTYSARQAILDGGNPRAMILDMIDSQCKLAVDRYTAPDYAAGAFAQFAGSQLGVPLDAVEFTGCEYPEAEIIAKERAIDTMPIYIQEAIDENLGGDDERDWKWQELARVAESRFSFKTNVQELKKIGKENLGEKLQEAAYKMVQGIDLTGGARFLERRYSLESLCDWARQQFGANIDVATILGKDTSEIIDEMQKQIRQLYRQKDLEFPIEAALATYLPERVVPGRRPNREQLFGWTMHRFRSPEVSEDLFRTEPRSIVKDKLMEVHKTFLPTADYAEIDAKLEDVFSGATVSEAADATEIVEWARATLSVDIDPAKLTSVSPKQARDVLMNAFDIRYRPEMHSMERRLVLDELDSAWKSHLLTMDHLRSTVGMAGYAQEDPKIVYKKEGMKLFETMWDGIHEKTTKLVFKMEDIGEEQVHSALWAGAMAVHQEAENVMRTRAAQVSQEQAAQVKAAAQAGGADAEPKKIETIRNVGTKVGRNDPCHCGSGKKYKNCHMKSEQRN
jgi:preprotein translocase subunit SecA